MRRNRAEIVGDEMRKVMQDIISNELKDPRVPLLTSVTQVKMTRDLSHATVFISPELHFKLDNTLDEAARMDAIIDRVKAEDKAKREELGIADEDEVAEEED